MPPPQLMYSNPIIIERRYGYNQAPLYLRVPPGHHKNWRAYCSRYNACNRPVYFVRDDWYQNTYAPRYMREHPGRGYAHGHDRKVIREEHRRRDHRDHRDHWDRKDNRYYKGRSDRDDNGRGDRDDYGRGHDKDHGNRR